MDHNRHLHMDLVLSLILLAWAKRKGKRIKEKLTSIIRKLYRVSSRRSIIFSPAWDFIRSSRKREIKAPHINLCRLAAHLLNTKQVLTPLKIQDPRSQWHGDLEATAEHYLTPNKLSTKLCQQDGEINWQEVIMNLILACPPKKPTTDISFSWIDFQSWLSPYPDKKTDIISLVQWRLDRERSGRIDMRGCVRCACACLWAFTCE